MAGPHVLTAVLALLIFVGLPSMLAMVAAADVAAERAYRFVRRVWRDRVAGRLAALLCRAGLARPPAPPAEPVGPSIEYIAAELRRLGRARVGIATRSGIWFNAVQHAYDARLRMACRALDVPEHLDGLVGVDREIERLRVAGALEAAGLVLNEADSGQRPGRT